MPGNGRARRFQMSDNREECGFDKSIRNDGQNISHDIIPEYQANEGALNGELYEKQRDKQIKENKEKMVALGLTGIYGKVSYSQEENRSRPSRRMQQKVSTDNNEARPQSPTHVISNIPRRTPVRRSLRNIIQQDTEHTESPNNQEKEIVDSSDLHTSSATTHDQPPRVRGCSRGILFAKKRKLGDRLDIVIPEDRKRIVGKNASDLITEAGILVRQNAPLEFGSWKYVPVDRKKKLWETLKDKLKLVDDLLTKTVVLNQLGSQFRNYRNRLHKNYYLPHDTFEKAVEHCPPEFDKEKWRAVCLTFNDDKFKQRSQINKDNRSKQKLTHGNGSMGFARREYELMNDDTKERPKMTTLWKKTHWSTKKEDWTSVEAKEVHDKAVEIITSLKADGVDDVDEDKIFSKILGKKRNYIRGRGPGPTPVSSVHRLQVAEKEKELIATKELAEKEIAAARHDAEVARKDASEKSKQLEDVMAKQDEMSNQMKTMMMMLTNLQDSNKTSSKVKSKKR